MTLFRNQFYTELRNERSKERSRSEVTMLLLLQCSCCGLHLISDPTSQITHIGKLRHWQSLITNWEISGTSAAEGARKGSYLTLPVQVEEMSNKARKSSGNIMLTAGAPMVIFIVGGSVALGNFMQTHFDLKDKAKNSTTTRKFDLEEEHSRMMKQLNVQDFSLSRIPRPEELEEASRARMELKEKKKWSPKTAATEKPEKPQNASIAKIAEGTKSIALNTIDIPPIAAILGSSDETSGLDISNKRKKGWLW